MKKTFKNSKGITLVALVITIIILLILAGISISALTNTGIFQKAKDAKQKSENAALDQNTKLDEYENELDKYLPKQNENNLAKAVKVGDYVAYKPDELDNNALTTLKTNLKNYSGASDNTTNSAIARDSLSWRVLDVDETTGVVRLISATPTNKSIELKGYNGYNNAVKLLDDACSTLYNSKLATKVQNLKIEDIQDKMKEKDYSKLYSEYGKPQIPLEHKKYPSILAQEKNQKVNEYEGTLDLSKQDNYINQTDVLEANSLEIKTTAWVKNDYEVLTADDFEGDYGQIYSDMFFKDYTYWMSSRCISTGVDAGSVCANFGVRVVGSGVVFAGNLYYSNGYGENPFAGAFRPCITLNSNVQVTSGDGSESTPFEIK